MAATAYVAQIESVQQIRRHEVSKDETFVQLEVKTIAEKDSTEFEITFLRDFISNEISFKKQFDSLNEFYVGIEKEEALNKMRLSLSELLLLNPKIFSMELSRDRNILYSFIKDDYTIYITHFLDDCLDADDEAFVSIFQNKRPLPNFSGSLENAMTHIGRYTML